MSKQDLIIYEMKQISLWDLDEDQVMILANDLVNSISLSKLNRAVKDACIKLSGVTAPSFMADARWVALDNQKRLEIIWEMLDSFDKVEADIKNLKGKLKNYLKDKEQDFDYIFQFLLNVKSLVSSVYEYGEFKANEVKENKKQALLQKERFKLLENIKIKEGNEHDSSSSN